MKQTAVSGFGTGTTDSEIENGAGAEAGRGTSDGSGDVIDSVIENGSGGVIDGGRGSVIESGVGAGDAGAIGGGGDGGERGDGSGGAGAESGDRSLIHPESDAAGRRDQAVPEAAKDLQSPDPEIAKDRQHPGVEVGRQRVHAEAGKSRQDPDTDIADGGRGTWVVSEPIRTRPHTSGSDVADGRTWADTDAGNGRVTVRAVAAAAGLSVATVSRVLNDRENVSAATRRKVQDVVERLGARAPEPRRRSPVQGPRPPVFVRCPYLLTDYFGHIVTSVAETLALHGQEMILDVGDATLRSTAVRGLPTRKDAHGAVLILPPESRTDLEALAARSYPFVIVDPRITVPRKTVSISAAHFSGARAVTRHLIGLGHRRIGVISGPPYWRARDDRVGGHLAALSEAGLLGDPALMRHGEPAAHTGVTAGGELLDLPAPTRPTAIVCFNDKVAVGVLEAAAARNLRVPDDLSVTGFDDIDVSRATTPRLTTVRQPLQEMGRVAVTMLMRQLEGHAHEALSIELATELIVRESTGPAH